MNIDINKIRKIKHYEIITGLFLFIALVSPGILILFIYKLTLFKELDFTKILFLSLSISLPMFIVNLLSSFIFISDDEKRYYWIVFVCGAYWSAAIFYMLLGLQYFHIMSISLYSLLFQWIIFSLIVFVGALLYEFIKKMKSKK